MSDHHTGFLSNISRQLLVLAGGVGAYFYSGLHQPFGIDLFVFNATGFVGVHFPVFSIAGVDPFLSADHDQAQGRRRV